MSRRGQIILLPFLAVPLILLLILGSITFFRGATGRTTTPEPAAIDAEAVATSVADPTAAPALTDEEPVPTVRPEDRAAIDAEDALVTALYRDRSSAVVAIRILGSPEQGGFRIPRLPDGEPDFNVPPGATPEPEFPIPPDGDPEEPDFGFSAQGSGFLLDNQGHIVTNNHVVEGAENIQVTFSDGATVEAEIVGTDADSDLAVLKVERVPEDVRPLQLADSGEVEVGQRAIAIGNPFGLNLTLTVGVVSARGRTIPSRAAGEGGLYSLADVLQTDAAVNPGNSGGPLFNSAGEVIGVNYAIRTEGGAYEGVSFAIPSNTVRKVTTALIETGEYEHPYLGISMGQPITDAVARELGLPVQNGVPVAAVVEGGPASEAGVEGGTDEQEVLGIPYATGGDIVLKIDDRDVNSSSDVIDYLATNTVVGQTVTLTVLRNGEEVEVPVVLGARPTDD